MSIIVKEPSGNYCLMTKGAPDVVLARTIKVRLEGHDRDKTQEHTTMVESAVDFFGTKALRTLAVAKRHLEESQLGDEPEHLETAFVIMGIHGIMDPPRPEVLESIRQCNSAGIRTVLPTFILSGIKGIFGLKFL